MSTTMTIDAALCPSCPTTDQVRCIVLGEGLWQNVAFAMLPFLVIGALTVWAHHRA